MMIGGTPQDVGTPWGRIVNGFGADTGDVGASDWVQLEQALAHASELTERLEKELSTLSHVDAQSQIYPETEERYAIMEELKKELSTTAVKLGETLPHLGRRVERCRQNLERVRADAAKLNQSLVREGYSQAEEAARKQHMEALHYRDRVVVALTKARSVLDVAGKKKFPGREPRRPTPSTPTGPDAVRGGPGDGEGTVEQDEGGNETDRLIALGPLPGSAEATE